MIKLEKGSQYLLIHSIEKINRQILNMNFLESQVNLSKKECLLDIKPVYQSLHASQPANARENLDGNSRSLKN